jgi:hypothetical protein
LGGFEYLDDTTDAIHKIREKGIQPTVISPCPRHELDHALGEPQSIVPFITLVFGMLGCFVGYSFTAWTASDWVLPVGGKPILAIPAFTVIAFELTILLAALHTLIGVILLCVFDTLRNPIPNGAKQYARFQRDRFGIVVPCEQGAIGEFQEILKQNGAEEVHAEQR